MLTFEDRGTPIAKVKDGRFKGEILSVDEDDEGDKYMSTPELNLKKSSLTPLIDPFKREVCYIAGPSGSGKSYYSSNLVKSFKVAYPKSEVYLFSRTDWKDDPAYKEVKPMQVDLDTIAEEPLDITEIKNNSLVIFDDCNTIPDDKIKKQVIQLMEDIMEVGRKLKIWIIITNHLVNPNEKKLGRTIMNEMQSFTFFPKSGSAYQIKYCLKNYFGMSNTQINRIMQLKSRWVTVKKNYPQTVMYKHGAYIL